MNNTNYISLHGLRNNITNKLNTNELDVMNTVQEGLDTIKEGDFSIFNPLESGTLTQDAIEKLISDINPDTPESIELIAGFKDKYGLSKGSYQLNFIPILVFYMLTIFIIIGVYRTYPIKTQSPFNRKQFFEIIIGSLLIIFFYGFVRSILLGYPLMIKESMLLAGFYIIGYMTIYGLMYRTFKDKNQVMH